MNNYIYCKAQIWTSHLWIALVYDTCSNMVKHFCRNSTGHMAWELDAPSPLQATHTLQQNLLWQGVYGLILDPEYHASSFTAWTNVLRVGHPDRILNENAWVFPTKVYLQSCLSRVLCPELNQPLPLQSGRMSAQLQGEIINILLSKIHWNAVPIHKVKVWWGKPQMAL